MNVCLQVVDCLRNKSGGEKANLPRYYGAFSGVKFYLRKEIMVTQDNKIKQKPKTNKIILGCTLGCAGIIVILIILGVIGSIWGKQENQTTNDNSDQSTEQPAKATEQSIVTVDQTKKRANNLQEGVGKFELIKTKTETDEPNSKIDLYAYTGSFSLESLKLLCKENKQKYNAGSFYSIVIFDSKDNAEFPKDPITAQYGSEEDKAKHIKAFYLYNQKNGYSKLDYYDLNMWEGVAKTEDI